MRRAMFTLTMLCFPALAAGEDVPAETAPPVDATARLIFRHVPPAEADEAQPLKLAAAVENAWAEAALVVRYRRAGSAEAWTEVAFERSSTGAYHAVIPAAAVDRPGVEYFVVGLDKGGVEHVHFATAEAPHEVRVEPPAQARWVEAEHRRLAGRYDEVAFELSVANFGTFGLNQVRDYYVRSEVAWTHRAVTTLYSFSLGYGFVEGVVPEIRDEMVTETDTHGARYGFGQVRLRLATAAWVDAGVLLGFSHEGFAPGVRAQLKLGRPWRTHVTMGAEVIADLGLSWWLALTWDTAQPFLMTAKLMGTELPGTVLEAGSVVSLQIDYPVTERITVGAGFTWSAHERRPGTPGGILAMAMEL